MLLFYIIVVKLAAVVASAHEHQLSNELSNGNIGARSDAQMEKMQLASLQEIQNDRVIENNLLEQPEVEAHAIYVEPPANFKPIIYTEYGENQRPSVQTAQVEPMQVATSNNDHHHHQDDHQHQHHLSNNHQKHYQHSQELKPSVGRWTDWHDMSVEPDLASSDTFASLQYQPNYKNRYGATLAPRQPAMPALVGYSPLAWITGHTMLSQLGQFGGQPTVPGQYLSWQQQQQQQQPQQQVVSQAKPSYWDQQVPMPMSEIMQLDSQSDQRRIKRRRKFKQGNAEVRILRLVAASQQQQQQQQLQQLQQQQQQQQRQDYNQADYNQVNGLTAQHHNQRLQQKQMDVAVDQTQANEHHSPPPAKQPQPQLQPPVAKVIKRLGSGISTAGSGSGPATKHRQVKRRRVKTLLPVGLSSWFLGGIRALDGKHWHLPSEVINRLAVNDVDFVRQPAPQKVVPPQAGSVAMIGASQQANAGEIGASGKQTIAASVQADQSAPTPPTNRVVVPISQQVPR